MKSIKEYEKQITEATALINEAHNRLTIGNISLEDALEIYNLLLTAIIEIENASKKTPNIGYYISQNNVKILKLVFPQLAAILFFGPFGFIVLPFILKKLSAISDDILACLRQDYDECVRLANYCLLKDELLGLKALNLLGQNVDEEIKPELLEIMQIVLEKIYFYIIDDKLEINTSEEAQMMVTILRHALNSSSNDLMELLEELKIKMQDNPALTRKLPYTI